LGDSAHAIVFNSEIPMATKADCTEDRSQRVWR
jgi:hypothetical protein